MSTRMLKPENGLEDSEDVEDHGQKLQEEEEEEQDQLEEVMLLEVHEDDGEADEEGDHDHPGC